MEIHIGKGDSNEEPVVDNNTEEYEAPLVYDNPIKEEIEFKLDHQDKNNVEDAVVKETQNDSDNDNDNVELTVEMGEKEEEADGKSVVADYGDISTPYDPKRDLENYKYPTLDLLQKYESDGKPYIDMEEQTRNKNRIVEVLRSFGV